MVHEHGMRDIDITPTGSFDFETKVDVVERDCELSLIQSAHSLELALFNDEAGSSDCAHELSTVGHVEISRLVRGEEAVRVASRFPDPNDDAGMLYAAVFIEKLRPDGAYIRANGVAHHLAEPVGLPDFRVIVQQANIGPPAVPHRTIVDC